MSVLNYSIVLKNLANSKIVSIDFLDPAVAAMFKELAEWFIYYLIHSARSRLEIAKTLCLSYNDSTFNNSQMCPRLHQTTLISILCHALLSTPRKFQSGATLSGWLLYWASTALTASCTVLPGTPMPSGKGTATSHRDHAHSLRPHQLAHNALSIHLL